MKMYLILWYVLELETKVGHVLHICLASLCICLSLCSKSIKMIRAGISQTFILKPWRNNTVKEITSNCLGNFSVTRGNKVQSVLLVGFKFSSSEALTYLFFLSWPWHLFSTVIHASNLFFSPLSGLAGGSHFEICSHEKPSIYCTLQNEILAWEAKLVCCLWDALVEFN